MTKKNTGKATPVSVAIAIVIVAVVALFLNTGEITVNFEDTSLKISSAYWVDLDISYSEIDAVTYRKDLDVGVRTNGLGSPRLSLGTFKNEEFGLYTLYAYTSAKEYVVLTSDDKTFVIGMSNEKDTQAIYDTILVKIAEGENEKHV